VDGENFSKIKNIQSAIIDRDKMHTKLTFLKGSRLQVIKGAIDVLKIVRIGPDRPVGPIESGIGLASGPSQP
jgi:hypothetical protein